MVTRSSAFMNDPRTVTLTTMAIAAIENVRISVVSGGSHERRSELPTTSAFRSYHPALRTLERPLRVQAEPKYASAPGCLPDVRTDPIPRHVP